MASIKDVAARAGVSVATASRVLNDSTPVTLETRDRVLAAVQAMDYSIDQRARALRRQKSGTLGLIVAEIRNPFFTEAIHSIEAIAYENNHSLFLCNSDEDPERERFHLRAMQAQRIDGIIILPVTASGRPLLPLVGHEIPVVCLDRRVYDLDLDVVLVDNVAGARLAVAHLAALGHQRIGYIGGRPVTPGIERLEGYRRGLEEYGIPEDPHLMRDGDSMRESGYREALALLDLADPPTAIFVINNPMSLGALTAIHERGLRVPQDISVVGFDDAPWSALLDPPLTTVAQPTDRLGRAAVRLLLERIDGGYAGPARRVILPPHFVAQGERARAVGASRVPGGASAATKWHYRATATEETPAGWPIGLLRRVGMNNLPGKVPGVVRLMGDKCGELSAAVAHELGLRQGIAVSISGIDAHAGMVGMDVLTPRTLAFITGTSTCHLAQSPRAVFDRGLWGPFEAAVIAGEWTLEAGQASTGGTVRWLLDTLGGVLPPGAERYAAADAAAAAVLPGADGLTVLDFWQGSRTPIKDPAARGTIWGLTTTHGPGHLLRAVYEGTAYGNRHILEMLDRLGVSTERIVACGGGTRSMLWLQILADVAGVPITLPETPDAVALGTALCAAVGAGAYPDLRAAGRAMVRLTTTVEPNAAMRAPYDEGYGRYKDTYAALAPLF